MIDVAVVPEALEAVEFVSLATSLGATDPNTLFEPITEPTVLLGP
jgi:hypothetical protein